MSCPGLWTRREFGWLSGGWLLRPLLASLQASRGPWDDPAEVAVVYLAADTPHWPRPDLDLAREHQEVSARLHQYARQHSTYLRLVDKGILRRAEEVPSFVNQLGDVDGVLMVPLCQPTPPLQPLVQQLPVPAVMFSRPYATHGWSAIAGLRKSGSRVAVVASSSYSELDPYLRAFRTIRHVRKSRVLVGTENPAGRQKLADEYRQRFGTEFRFVGGKFFEEAFRRVDSTTVDREVEKLVKEALRVIEPSPQEIRNGVQFYLAIRDILRREQVNAVTIDCFGTLAANTLPGYPCIAWSKLNDAGYYGVCEADLNSAVTQLVVTSYAGVPGFVSDPVFDVGRNEVIHAHCVAATRMLGFDKPASPFLIRNHLETNEGATLQVLMPGGQPVTVARFNGPRLMLLSTGEAIGAVESDRGCRTQLRTRVTDARRWLDSYQAGLHRVVFYGDHTRAIEILSQLMGFEILREI